LELISSSRRKAGTHRSAARAAELWIPASAGMTSVVGTEALIIRIGKLELRVPSPLYAMCKDSRSRPFLRLNPRTR
jgi:hypothetical protein